MASKLPDRTAGGAMSDDEAVPDHDPSNVELSLQRQMKNLLTSLRLQVYSSNDFKPTNMHVGIWRIISLLPRR